MKKIYLLASAALIGTATFAQYRVGNGPTVNGVVNMTTKVYKKTQNNKAQGDSLMYFDSEGFYLVDAQDNTDFVLTNEDIDGNGDYGNTNWPSPSGDSFQFSFFDDDVNETPHTSPDGNFFPNDLTSGTDSAFYIAATSWFNSGSLTANNWFNFGPITIPAGTNANMLHWFDRSNPGWTDGYDVYIVNMNNLTDPNAPSGIVDVTANSLTPDYTRAAVNSPTPQPGSDTTWTQQSVQIPNSLVGQRVFIFINHDMNDGDVLYLDEMWVEEGPQGVGIEELNELTFNVFPNPSNNGIFTINLTSKVKESTTLTVRNVVGQTIINRNIAVTGQTKETISLANYSKGVYFLTIGNETIKLIVE